MLDVRWFSKVRNINYERYDRYIATKHTVVTTMSNKDIDHQNTSFDENQVRACPVDSHMKTCSYQVSRPYHESRGLRKVSILMESSEHERSLQCNDDSSPRNPARRLLACHS